MGSATPEIAQATTRALIAADGRTLRVPEALRVARHLRPPRGEAQRERAPRDLAAPLGRSSPHAACCSWAWT